MVQKSGQKTSWYGFHIPLLTMGLAPSKQWLLLGISEPWTVASKNFPTSPWNIPHTPNQQSMRDLNTPMNFLPPQKPSHSHGLSNTLPMFQKRPTEGPKKNWWVKNGNCWYLCWISGVSSDFCTQTTRWKNTSCWAFSKIFPNKSSCCDFLCLTKPTFWGLAKMD